MANVKLSTKGIDKDKFELAIKVGMTNQQIIELFAINNGTLMRFIKETYHVKKPLVALKKLRAEGELAFRASQFQLAKKDKTISIWIDKTVYGRTDEITQDTAGTIEDLTPLSELLKINPGEVEQSQVKEEEEATEENGTSENIDN